MQTVANHQPIVLPSSPTGPDKPTSQAQKPWRTPHLSMLKLEQTQKNLSCVETGSSGPKAGS
jgi:hypothetical protein